jgi:hypothetical protein
MAHENIFKLPRSIVSPSDLKRVKRELDTINDSMLQMEIRQGGEEQAKLPKTSKQLDEVAELNKLNLLHKTDREHLTKLVEKLVDKAPVIHMSFSAEPSGEFLDGLTKYLRESFDQYILITIGLAPSIGAGCIVRTTNKFFDLSLKQTLLSHKTELFKEIAKVNEQAEALQAVPAQEAAA